MTAGYEFTKIKKVAVSPVAAGIVLILGIIILA